MAKSCFFISRIGDAGSPEREFSDKLLKYIVAPVLEKCGYDTPVRADHITQPGVITTQVFQHLWNDDLVVADLTGGNPNVFYELAVRHIRRKPFVHLIQAGHKIPFDIAPNRTIVFDFDIEKAEQAKSSLELTVRAASETGGSVQTALSAAIDFSKVDLGEDPVPSAISQVLSIVQEMRGTLFRIRDSTAVRLNRKPERPTLVLRKLDDGFLKKVDGLDPDWNSMAEPSLRKYLLERFPSNEVDLIFERLAEAATVMLSLPPLRQMHLSKTDGEED